jgi:ribose transport system permease protein
MATYVGMGGIVSSLHAIGLVLGSAILVGLINGLLISKLDLEPLIATLATGSIVSGITLSIMPQPGGYVPRSVNQIWLHEVGGFVPLTFIYFLVAAGLCYWFLRYTPLGRKIYALGGDKEKAKIAGINVDKIQVTVYVGSALLAALSGLALAARIRSGDPLAGGSFTLASVAAVLIGGTTFKGGIGGVVRTVAGVLILTLLGIILNFSGVSPFYQNILSGAVVIIAVVYSSFGG